jgi:hypothetical protein
MLLFSVIVEFDGGTYISQFRARSAQRAAANFAAHLVGIKGMSTLANRKRLASCLSREHPVAIQGVRNVWCCSASIGKKFALVNIVATVQSFRMIDFTIAGRAYGLTTIHVSP